MRRTEQEFKAEVLRRSNAYRRRRAEKRKKMVGIGICTCLCIAVLAFLTPMGGAGRGNAAPEAMLSVGGLKTEMSMAQSPECAPEYAMDSAAPMEEEPAAEPVVVKIVNDEEEIILDATDSAVIINYLSGDWIQNAANCLCDYTLEVGGEIYRYHSDCGTIQNESCQSLTLSEADKLIVNDILETYMN